MARRPNDQAEALRPSERRSRRMLVVPLCVLALGLLAWWLPAILAATGAVSWIVARATGDLQGSIQIGSTSLGWLSPIAVSDVTVRDAAGQPMAEVPRIEGDRRLWDVIRTPSDLGRFRLAQPRLRIVLSNNTSNVEQLLAKYLANPLPSTRTLGLVVEVTEGRAEIVDATRNASWQLEKLALSASVPSSGAGAIEIRAAVGFAGNPAARLTAECKWPQSNAGAGREFALDAQSVPLELLTPLAERFQPGTRIAGRGTCNLRLDHSNNLRGSLAAEPLQVTASMLAEPVQLRQLKLNCDLAWPSEELVVRQLTADCELGRLSLSGTLSRAGFSTESLLASLRKQAFEVNGRIDLAALATSLPRTLRIRAQTQITTGQLELSLACKPDGKGAAWQGRIQAGELKGVVEGRPIAWQQPLAVNFSLRDAPEAITLETFKCQSSFFNLEAQGRPEEMAAAARFDLGQLVTQLEQFVDLGGIRATGEGWAHVNWKSPDRRAFGVDLECQAREFRLVLPGQPAWEEPNLVLLLSATGQMVGGVPARVESATVKATAAADQLEARLLQPVADWRTAVAWPIEARLQGRFEAWPGRLRNWIDLGVYKPAGTYDLTARLAFSSTLVSAEQTRLLVNGLNLTLPGVTIAEPSVQLTTTADWDRSKGQVKLRNLALSCTSLALEGNNLALDLPPNDLRLAGTIKYQGDLERLRQWLPRTTAEPTWNVGGRVVGSGNVDHSGNSARAALDATIDGLVLVDAGGQRITEPQVRLVVRGVYDRAKGEVQFEECSLISSSLTVQAGGRMAGVGRAPTTDLNGTAQYDLQRLSALLQPWIPSGIRFTGQGKDPFSIRGPLNSAEAQGEAAVNWNGAYVYGFQAGPGQLKAKLAQGVIRAEPIVCELSEGKSRLTPRVRLAPLPAEFSLESGLVAEQVRINPTMCQYALSYAAPALAGVATAEGRISIQLDRCRFPLANLDQGDLAGKLMIHTVEVGPGPLIAQITSALGYTSPAKLSRESSIPFWVQNRRIHHQGMELIFPDVTVRTTGSVGFDRTMDLVVSMPVPEKWIGQNPLGTALRGQTLSLPVSGTLDQPRLDRRAIEDVSRQLMGTAARNLLEDRFKQQLNRLLPSR